MTQVLSIVYLTLLGNLSGHHAAKSDRKRANGDRDAWAEAGVRELSVAAI